MAQSGCRLRDTFPQTQQFSPNYENINYLLPDDRYSTGRVVIVPEMKFDCYGKITGWSSLTRFSSSNLAIQHLKHDITFHLWRPRPGVCGNYTFVGSKRLDFVGRNLRRGVTDVGGTRFFKFISAQPDDDVLYFRPGDVIGWYVHTVVQSVDMPLSVAYTTGSDILTPVDVYSTTVANGNSEARPPCEISIFSEQTSLTRSVVPFLTVDYGMLILPIIKSRVIL